MALIKILKKRNQLRTSVHKETECTYIVFTNQNGKYLQLDTEGSKDRKIKGKISQTIQFGPEAIAQLKEILKEF